MLKTMGGRFQRVACLLSAVCAAGLFAPGASTRALAEDLNAEQVSKKFTPSVMLVVAGSSTNPDDGNAFGTAFVLSEDGIVCTNYHVINGEEKFVLRSSTGGIYPITAVLATDKKHDIAILKADAHGLTPLEFGDYSKVAPGQKVFIIGNPRGYESTITEGIVSSLRDDGPKGPVLQISAAISPGSSGSPVFNAQGQVIAMATYFREDAQSLNFAIPANELAALLATAKNAKAAGTAEAPGPAAAGEHLYEPDPKVHGSKEQDASVFKDERYAKLKEAEQAYDCFEMLTLAKQLVKDYPESSAASRALSDAYESASMPDEAFKAAHRALDLDPDSGRAWDDLAGLYETYSDDGETIAAIYAHAVELAPDDAKLLIEYAQGMRSTSRGTALSALNHAKRLLLDDKGADEETRGYHLYASLVYAYDFLGLHQEAYDSALALLNKTTSDAWLYLAYANAADLVGKPTYVKATIDKAISLDPACKKEAFKTAARFYYRQGDANTAISYYKQVCNIDSRDFSALSDLVYVISNKPQLGPGDYQDLDTYIGEIKAINPKLGKEIEDKVADIIRQK